MKYRIVHTINTDADTFWNRIFFEDDFNQALFRDHLKFRVSKVMRFDKDSDGTIHRTLECEPNVELPAVARKVIGDAARYVEHGTYDPSTRRYVAEVVPASAADKIKSHVELWVEARGEKQCERMVDVTNDVKIFGIGGVLEKFIEQQTRKTYDEAAEFTNRWIAEKGL